MVFFICSHCGASLKKSKVDKHYAIQCRNPPQVSCMDCHKEFRGNDYVAHTKCITEDEKYSAKGFVPKPNSNKGECKQQEWLDVVRGVQSQENLPKCLKIVLDNIVKFENIPRKKPKFVNFLKNNNIKLGPNDLDQLWELLEKEHKRVKENAETNTTNKVPETKSEDSTVNGDQETHTQNGDMSVEIVDNCEATPKDKIKKKDKKRKSKDTITDVNEKEADKSSQAAEEQNDMSMDIDQECEDTTKSKPKKKKNKTEAINGNETQENNNLQVVEPLNENSSIEVTCEVTPKEKTKKKKNKKANGTESVDNIEIETSEKCQVPEKQNEINSVEVSEESFSPKGKTKDVKKEFGAEAIDDSEKQVAEGKAETVTLTKKQKKEKKKREKYEAELKEIENSQFNDPPLEEDDEQNRKKKKSKKDKDVNGLDSNVNGVIGVQSEELSVKPKKKRHLDDEQSDEPSKKKKKEPQGDEQVEEMCGVESVTAENSNGLQKFTWNEIVLEVVRAKGGEIPVKRLRKKVLAEYQNCCGSVESEDKLIVKFNKKLPKVPGIIVHKEVVKLAE